MSKHTEETMTPKEARQRLGLGKRDRVSDYLPQWLGAEERLATLVVETEDLIVRAKYEEDLRSLREVISVLRETPSRKRRFSGMWVWAAVVTALLGAGFVGYQKWVVNGSRETPAPKASFDDRKPIRSPASSTFEGIRSGKMNRPVQNYRHAPVGQTSPQQRSSPSFC